MMIAFLLLGFVPPLSTAIPLPDAVPRAYWGTGSPAAFAYQQPPTSPVSSEATQEQADPHNLEEGFPVSVEDAFPIGYREREFQIVGHYDDGGRGNPNTFTLDPGVEWGVAPRSQLRLYSRLVFTSRRLREQSGDVAIDSLHNFSSERGLLPALAYSVGVDFPTGKESRGIDAFARLLATKTLGTDRERSWRLHINAAWRHSTNRRTGAITGKINDEQEENEGEAARRNRFEAAMGMSRWIDSATVFVADVAYSEERERSETPRLLEIGLRRRVTPFTVVSLGIGAGVGSNTPTRSRVTLGIQAGF